MPLKIFQRITKVQLDNLDTVKIKITVYYIIEVCSFRLLHVLLVGGSLTLRHLNTAPENLSVVAIRIRLVSTSSPASKCFSPKYHYNERSIDDKREHEH